jgi:hypothetical protein
VEGSDTTEKKYPLVLETEIFAADTQVVKDKESLKLDVVYLQGQIPLLYCDALLGNCSVNMSAAHTWPTIQQKWFSM